MVMFGLLPMFQTNIVDMAYGYLAREEFLLNVLPDVLVWVSICNLAISTPYLAR